MGNDGVSMSLLSNTADAFLDQSFSIHSLKQLIQRKDYGRWPELTSDAAEKFTLEQAEALAHDGFGTRNPLTTSKTRGKAIYQPASFADVLVLRKLRSNIQRFVPDVLPSRHFIVTNMIHCLSEGVAYRLYRLDVESFYESISIAGVLKKVKELQGLSTLSKNLCAEVLALHSNSGVTGVPRGVPLSATLAELMMSQFDREMALRAGVYLYYRFVDDIFILTNREENKVRFLHQISQELPSSLKFHLHKRAVCEVAKLPKKITAIASSSFAFNYLGYEFRVQPPASPGQDARQHRRLVEIDIADSKIRKIKTKIVLAFCAFAASGDFELLRLRIKYLTANMRIKDFYRNTYKLSGIYFNYPNLTSHRSPGLLALDRFLANAVASDKGRLFSRTAVMLSTARKAAISRYSFVRGYEKRCFYHFPVHQIRRILRCWTHDL